MLDENNYHNDEHYHIEENDGKYWSQKCHPEYNSIIEKAAESENIR